MAPTWDPPVVLGLKMRVFAAEQKLLAEDLLGERGPGAMVKSPVPFHSLLCIKSLEADIFKKKKKNHPSCFSHQIATPPEQLEAELCAGVKLTLQRTAGGGGQVPGGEVRKGLSSGEGAGEDRSREGDAPLAGARQEQ